MHIPNYFYYDDKSEESHYGKVPPGQLHVGRMLQNRPHWKKPRFDSQKKPKTLILSDWRAGSWTAGQIEEVQEILTALNQQGFTLYFWNGNDLVSLDQQGILGLKPLGPTFNSGLETADELIKKACLKYQLSADQVFVVDDYQIQLLYAPNSEYRIFDTNYQSFGGNKLFLDWFLKQQNHHPMRFALTQFPVVDPDLVKLKDFNSDFDSIVLSTEDAQTLLTEGLIKVGNALFTLGDDIEYLTKLTTLSSASFSATELTQILKIAPGLRELCLTSAEEMTDVPSLSELAKLELRYLGNAHTLHRLLCATAELKSL